MKFLTDTFQFRKNFLFRPTESLDLTHATEILNFEIGGSEPAGSERKILFQVDGEIFRFEGNNLFELHIEVDIENILEFGNTVAELNQVQNIKDWAGKKIYPIVAISYPADSPIIPTLDLGLKVKNFQDVFQISEVSEVFYLEKGAKFISANFSKIVGNGGTASMQVRLLKDDGWTQWLEIADAEKQNCNAVQLRGNLAVTSTSGSSSATIDDAEFVYITGENTGKISAIYLQAEKADTDLLTAYVLLKHSELVGTELKAFARFDELPEVKEEFLIGTGNGAVQTFEIDEGINFETLIVKVDGVRTLDFTLNAEQKTLSIEAAQDKEITVSYEYNLCVEDWQEMEKQFTIFDEKFESGLFTSRFVCRLDAAKNSKVAQFKIVSEITDTEDFEPIKIYHTATGAE